MVVLRKQPSSRTPSMNRQEAEDVLMKNEEHETPQEVSNLQEFGGMQGEEWSKFVRVVQEAKEGAVSVLSNAKLTKQIRTDLEEGWDQVKEAEWREYVRTVEKDGKLINESCELLGTDVFQLKRTVESRCGKATNVDEQAQLPGRNPLSTDPAHEDAGTANLHFLYYLRAMTCADQAVFKGSKDENFSEFPRKLEGSSQELAKLLACDSTASRMRALTELKNLRMTPSQEVAVFCVVLKKIDKQANPECTLHTGQNDGIRPDPSGKFECMAGALPISRSASQGWA
ncbi:hypothetical protein COOONC_00090 [Cooperia oncophora]